MLNAQNTQPIKVGILDISMQNKALLEFYFNGAGKSYFNEVDIDQASCFIIDYDSPGAKDSWETTFKETQKPGIIISIKAVELPSTVWIAKPLTVKALTDASVAIKEMIIIAEDAVEETSNEAIADIEESLKIIEKIEKEEVTTQAIGQVEEAEQERTKLDEIVSNTLTAKIVEKNITNVEADKLEAGIVDFKINIDKKVAPKEPELEMTNTSAEASAKKLAERSEFLDTNSNLEKVGSILLEDDNNSIGKLVTDNSETEALVANDIIESEATSKTEELTAILETVQNHETSSKDMSIGHSDNTKETISSEYLDRNRAIGDLDNTSDSNTTIDSLENTSKKSADEELQSLLEEIRHEAGDSDSSAQENKGYLQTSADERWKLTCGKDKGTQKLKNLCTISSDEHILATLLENIKKAKHTKTVLRIKYNNIITVVDTETDSIFCDESIFSKFYADVCHGTINNKNDIKVHRLDASEIRLYRNKIKAGSEYAHSIESFIWTTSLVTHRGYLPVDTDLNKKLNLKSWPNLTRLENIPHSIQVAATFKKNSKTLSEVINELNIPSKYIISFYNATVSLSLLTQDDSFISVSTPKKDDGKASDNKGVFSRLIQKLNT